MLIVKPKIYYLQLCLIDMYLSIYPCDYFQHQPMYFLVSLLCFISLSASFLVSFAIIVGRQLGTWISFY